MVKNKPLSRCLLFILFILPKIAKAQIIEFQYFQNKHENDIRVKASLGTPFQEYVFKVDLSSQYTILSTNDQLLSSSSYHNLNKEIKKGLFKGILSNDIFKIDKSNLISELPFLRYTPVISGGGNAAYLGLGRGEISLLANLFQSRLISKKIFQIERDNIIIGGFNETIRDRQLQSCGLISKESERYSCLLHKIDIGNSPNSSLSPKKESKGIVDIIFKSNYENISVPYSFWAFFKENYFKEYLLQNQCKYHEGMYSISVMCLPVVKMRLPDIKLIFDHAGLVLTPDDMFDDDVVDIDDMTLFRIEFVNDLTYCAIGTYVIKKYRMIFNNEEEVLQFVTDNMNNKGYNGSNASLVGFKARIICLVLIFFLICGISINAYFIRRNKWRDSRNNTTTAAAAATKLSASF